MSKPIYVMATPFFPSPTTWRGAYCLDFAKALVREGTFDVRVFVPGGGADYDIDGVHVTRFPTKSLPCGAFPMLFTRANTRSFLKALARAKIDLVDVAIFHDHLSESYGCAVKALNPNCRVLLHHHSLDAFSIGIRLGRFGLLPLYSDLLYLWQCRERRGIDCDVFCSPRADETYLQVYEGLPANRHVDVRRHLLLGRWLPDVPRKPVLYYENGVDTRMFHPAAHKRSDDRFVIGCIGNYLVTKDQLALIQAVERLNDKSLFVRLIGSGKCLHAFQRYVAEHGLSEQFSFETEVRHEKLPAFYQSFDLFVLPSYWEGLGAVYLEAWASGVPFIAAEGQGMDGFICPEDRAKWLCRAHDVEGLAKMIATYRANRWKQELAKPADIDVMVQTFVAQVLAIVYPNIARVSR